MEEKTSGFFDHVDELRVRVVRGALVYMLGFGLAWFLAREWVMDFLKAPLFSILPEERQQLYYTGLFENFLTHLKVSAYAALFLLSPYFFWEVWGFVAPGLYPKERKYAGVFIFAATFFFLAGAAFAYYLLFPIAYQFFVEFGSGTDTALLTIGNYVGVTLKLMLLFGLAFELPVLVVMLGALGVVRGEQLRKHRAPIIIGITTACALFAPPDAISMLVLMCPLILMFEGSIFVVEAIDRARKAREARRQQDSNTDLTLSGQAQKN